MALIRPAVAADDVAVVGGVHDHVNSGVDSSAVRAKLWPAQTDADRVPPVDLSPGVVVNLYAAPGRLTRGPGAPSELDPVHIGEHAVSSGAPLVAVPQRTPVNPGAVRSRSTRDRLRSTSEGSDADSRSADQRHSDRPLNPQDVRQHCVADSTGGCPEARRTSRWRQCGRSRNVRDAGRSLLSAECMTAGERPALALRGRQRRRRPVGDGIAVGRSTPAPLAAGDPDQVEDCRKPTIVSSGPPLVWCGETPISFPPFSS